MASSNHIRKGIEILRTVSPRDQDWVISDVRRKLKGPFPRVLAKLAALPTASGKRPSVFLSHSHADKTFVRSLARRLEEHGLTVWVDEVGLRVGDSLIERLRSAIDKADFLLAVLSPSSIKSRWVREELDLAMTRQIAGRRVRVLPLLKGRCKLPGFLAGKLFADFTTPYRRNRNFPVLVQSIYEHYGHAVA